MRRTDEPLQMKRTNETRARTHDIIADSCNYLYSAFIHLHLCPAWQHRNLQHAFVYQGSSDFCIKHSWNSHFSRIYALLSRPFTARYIHDS